MYVWKSQYTAPHTLRWHILLTTFRKCELCKSEAHSFYAQTLWSYFADWVSGHIQRQNRFCGAGCATSCSVSTLAIPAIANATQRINACTKRGRASFVLTMAITKHDHNMHIYMKRSSSIPLIIIINLAYAEHDHSKQRKPPTSLSPNTTSKEVSVNHQPGFCRTQSWQAAVTKTWLRNAHINNTIFLMI